jgi:hypothetical protein
MTIMTVRFGKDFYLEFEVEDTPIANLWLERMSKRHSWPLDDPERFYGFGNDQQEREIAETKLLTCINVINQYQHIITHTFTSIDDQDYLNYLHNIFERYHGLLDQQNTEWWHAAPVPVREAIAQLNILVHRTEIATKNNKPRFMCTWWGMPKDKELSQELIEKYGTPSYNFGGVYLLYSEVGKTVENLSIDNDNWIGDDAFKPFLHYSADFDVRFFNGIADITKICEYFEQHKDFFAQRGIDNYDDYRARPYLYKVAQLKTTMTEQQILSTLANNQYVTDIYIE